MKKIMAILISTLIIYLLLNCTSTFNKYDNSYFLNDVNFSEGNYALYIKHNEHGDFMVTDQKALILNKNKLRVKTGFINYLPGEANRSYGVLLFKNKNLVKRKQGGYFSIFEIGNLKKYGLPVKDTLIRGNREIIEPKMEELKLSENKFIISKPEFSKDYLEFYFDISFPSVVLPVTREVDKYGNEKIKTVNGTDYDIWLNKEEFQFNKVNQNALKTCIKQKINVDINIDIEILYSTVLDTYIAETDKGWGNELRNNENKILTLKDYIFYNYKARIFANKENINKLYQLDFDDCKLNSFVKTNDVLYKAENLVLKSNKPNLSLSKGELTIINYFHTVTKSKEIYQKEYFLQWVEIVN